MGNGTRRGAADQGSGNPGWEGCGVEVRPADLVRHGLVAQGRADRIVSLHGVKMGRPSRIHIAIASADPSTITRVHVGGEAVLVGEGTLTL